MTKKTVEEIYQKKDLHRHILDRPDTYIGSNKIVCEEQYVIVDEKIKKKIIEYNPSFIKIFDEVLVNAIDHSVREDTVTSIKIWIENDVISVENNGKGIPVVKHKDYDVYVPELIFGQLLTSSNYDDTEKRIVGGRNGLGGTCANIYSQLFIVETIDDENNLYYFQEFSNNMFDKKPPVIKKTSKKPFTKITFKPDYKRFKMKGIDKDTLSLIVKRIYDCTACTNKNVSVYYNGTKLKQKDFQQYISLFSDEKFCYEKIEEDGFIWEIAANINETYEQVSFVNGIATTQGGRHVDYILTQIIKKLTEMIKTKKKIDNIKPSYIKDRLFLFVRATVVNPNFSSQTKEFLTTPSKDFGVKVDISDAFITKLYKSGIVEDVMSFTKYKNDLELKKTTTDTRRKTRLRIENLEDANNAGTKKSKNCVLFITEGLSAKTFAMSGLSVIGRDNYGIIPLRGKALNVREATQKQLVNNEEVNNLKQIIGLQHGKKYTSVEGLRYGSVCILTDQDADGSHIKALIVNMFHMWWPELLDIKGFLISMKTPIVKVTKSGTELPFYTLKDFKSWEKTVNSKSWNVKYYKGLGTSTSKEAKDIFKTMDKNLIKYFSSSKSDTDKSILLAFEKKQADIRKNWLQCYNFDLVLDQADQDVSYSDLINKELIHFSMYDVIRSIPSICDGLKPSQRKVIYTMFKKNYQKEIKVAQLGAAVAETTSYHHGEASLYGTIVNMATDYPGSNNLNLLKPNGQFGSRSYNGKDAASPRYIFTELNDCCKDLFNKDDFNIFEYQKDDGQVIEPLYYVPVLPLILINGAQGIGTGYSTNIPCHNPKDILINIKRYLLGKHLIDMKPWYKGYTGDISQDPDNDSNYIMSGIYEKLDDTSIIIKEIPLGIAIDDYKIFIDKLVEDNKYGIVNFKNNSTENTPCFTLIFDNKNSTRKFLELDVLKILKLVKNISTKNFHLINKQGTITKYETSKDILKEFIQIRLEYNQKRKDYLLNKYSEEIKILNNKIRFLKEIMDNKIMIFKKLKSEIDKILSERGYEKIDGGYSYLTSMAIYSFTKEKLEDLYSKQDATDKNIKNISSKSPEDILIIDVKQFLFKEENH